MYLKSVFFLMYFLVLLTDSLLGVLICEFKHIKNKTEGPETANATTLSGRTIVPIKLTVSMEDQTTLNTGDDLLV